MRSFSRRRIGRALLSAGAMAGLAGCGFHPVYMPTASGKAGPAQRGLQSVRVGIIPERPGQLLRQALQVRLGSDSGAEPPRYDLAVSYAISGEGLGISADTTATRIRYIGRASWTLFTHAPARSRVTTGSARAYDAMNVFDQQYFASDLETQAVQHRLARAVADQIARELAVWFRRHPDQAG